MKASKKPEVVDKFRPQSITFDAASMAILTAVAKLNYSGNVSMANRQIILEYGRVHKVAV